MDVHYENYFSLFEIDRLFGSKGSFFDIENITPHYEINNFWTVAPPRIEKVLAKTSEICI